MQKLLLVAILATLSSVALATPIFKYRIYTQGVAAEVSQVSQPGLEVTPEGLNFGTVGLGDFQSLSVQLTNTGQTTLPAPIFQISGATAGDWDTSTSAQSCDNGLAIGASCFENIRFAPTVAGDRSATLTVTSGTVSGGPVTLSGAGVEADPHWQHVGLLMHMDGVNNGTVFPDETGKTITRNGGPVTSTSQKKFSTAAAYFDGLNNNALVAPPINLTSNFTVEGWVHPTSLAGYIPVMGQWEQQDGKGSWLVAISESRIIFALGSYSPQTSLMTSSIVLNANTWNHFAIVKDGNIFKTFINGTVTSTASFAGSGLSLPTVNTTIGQYYGRVGAIGADGTTSFRGYMDEIRITNGVSRYTSDFTPATGPFLNQ